MPNNDSPVKKVLDATLKTAIAALDIPRLIKVPLTFITELSARFGDLPEPEQTAIRGASDDELTMALQQLDLATKYAAGTLAGINRIEDRLAALRTATRWAARWLPRVSTRTAATPLYAHPPNSPALATFNRVRH